MTISFTLSSKFATLFAGSNLLFLKNGDPTLFVENPRYTRKEIAQIISKRNTSGVVGVRIIKQKYRWKSDKRKESIYCFVEAAWSPVPYVRKKKLFSIDLYGEKEAWDMGLEARTKGLAEMVN